MRILLANDGFGDAGGLPAEVIGVHDQMDLARLNVSAQGAAHHGSSSGANRVLAKRVGSREQSEIPPELTPYAIDDNSVVRW